MWGRRVVETALTIRTKAMTDPGVLHDGLGLVCVTFLEEFGFMDSVVQEHYSLRFEFQNKNFRCDHVHDVLLSPKIKIVRGDPDAISICW